MSKLDVFYRRVLLTKFFSKGWGQPDNLKRIFEFRKILSDRDICQHLVPNDHPIVIDKEEIYDGYRLLTGHFSSPFNKHMPGIMPDIVKTAHFQMVLPKEWKGSLKPICLHLAGTGDHRFGRRRVMMAKPLLKESGIGSVILENPYYGVRKPKNQFRSSLDYVSDLFVMGGALILESIALFHWLESQGFGPLGITGISLGGHNASLAASSWHKPLSLIPCLSWSTASSVFTKGVLSGAIPWKHLQQQYKENDVYGNVLSKLIHSPEKSGRTKTEAFLMGKNFQNYLHTFDIKEKSPSTCVENILPSLSLNNGTITTSPISTLGSTKAVAQQEPISTSGSWSIHKRLLKGFHSSITSKELPLDAFDFMCGVMDECTHLGNFSVPVDPKLVIIVSAKNDAYVPRDRVMSLAELWPGAEQRIINRGHIGAFLLNSYVFRDAIRDSFERQIAAYYTPIQKQDKN